MENVFTFKSGVVVHLQRVSPFFVDRVALKAERDFIEANSKPVCPSYTVESAGGESYTYEHDETTVVQPQFAEDEELQEAWTTYLGLTVALDATTTEETVKVYAKEGVIDDPPDKWLKDQAYWGLEVPDDPRDARWTWLGDVASGWMEMLDLAMEIQRVRNPVEEAADAASKSFPDSVEVTAGDDAGRSTEEDGKGAGS